MKKNTTKGFTLIESMVSLGIVLIVLAGIYKIFMASHRNYVIQESITDMHQNIRTAIEFMTRELKNAVIIEEIDVNRVTFYTDCGKSRPNISTGKNSQNTLNDTKQCWGSNCWEKKKVAITSGKGATQIRKVLSNTDNQLTITPSWDPNRGTPDNTSTYHIVENKGFLKKDDNILRYTKGGSVNRSFIENITNFNLHCDPNNEKKIDITLTAKTSIKDPQMNNQYHYYTVKTMVVLRNPVNHSKGVF